MTTRRSTLRKRTLGPFFCLLLAMAGALPRPAHAQCAADIFPDEPDGVVDVFDLLVMFSCHGPPCAGDVNGDGTLDGVDLALLLLHWGPCEQDLVVGSTENQLVVLNITDPTTAAQGLRELDVFVQFDGPDDVLLSVFDADIATDDAGGFAHPAVSSGWEPLPQAFWDALGLTYDSFVTIGLQFGDGNDADPDPSFSASAGTVSGGWYQASPDFVQGRAGVYPGNRVRIATFTTGVGSSVDGVMTVSFWDAAGDPFFGTAVLAASARLGDVDADGTVGIQDFLAVLATWGACPSATDPCPTDADGSGAVGIEDLLIVLSEWG